MVVERFKKRVREVKKENWFNNNIERKMGLKRKILFWEDKWIEKVPLLHRFPRLYVNVMQKILTIIELRRLQEEQ